MVCPGSLPQVLRLLLAEWAGSALQQRTLMPATSGGCRAHTRPRRRPYFLSLPRAIRFRLGIPLNGPIVTMSITVLIAVVWTISPVSLRANTTDHAEEGISFSPSLVPGVLKLGVERIQGIRTLDSLVKGASTDGIVGAHLAASLRKCLGSVLHFLNHGRTRHD